MGRVSRLGDPGGWVDAGSVERPARDGAIGDRVVGLGRPGVPLQRPLRPPHRARTCAMQPVRSVLRVAHMNFAKTTPLRKRAKSSPCSGACTPALGVEAHVRTEHADMSLGTTSGKKSKTINQERSGKISSAQGNAGPLTRGGRPIRQRLFGPLGNIPPAEFEALYDGTRESQATGSDSTKRVSGEPGAIQTSLCQLPSRSRSQCQDLMQTAPGTITARPYIMHMTDGHPNCVDKQDDGTNDPQSKRRADECRVWLRHSHEYVVWHSQLCFHALMNNVHPESGLVFGVCGVEIGETHDLTTIHRW